MKGQIDVPIGITAFSFLKDKAVSSGKNNKRRKVSKKGKKRKVSKKIQR